MRNERHETVADNVSANHHFREVAKMIPHEEVDVSKMETTTPTREKSSAVGNAAAMREALENVRFYLPHFLQYMWLHCEDAEAGGYYEKILEVVNAALSVPPRNCDVGTAEEQYARVRAFCKIHHKVGLKCVDCPVNGVLPKNCALIWSQMPYDEGGAK